MNWKKVYTVNEFYDCPTLGIADFNDVSHIYEAILNSPEDADENRYYLMHVESDLMELVLEAWDIWINWKDAYDTEKVTLASQHPLPADQIRHKELKRLIGNRLTAIPEKSIIMKAEFRKLDKTQNSWEVCWHENSA